MKSILWIAASALLFLGAMAPRIDDPPPEPVSCPLCGGDPMIHVQRMFAFSDVASRAAVNLLRW